MIYDTCLLYTSLGNYNTAMSKNASAELISKVLYPNDNHVEGKILRLRQRYFLRCV